MTDFLYQVTGTSGPEVAPWWLKLGAFVFLVVLLLRILASSARRR